MIFGLQTWAIPIIYRFIYRFGYLSSRQPFWKSDGGSCTRPGTNLDFWPLQTLCCSPPVSLEVWRSLSQCHASSGASAAAAEPAPTQVQDLAETTNSKLTHCSGHYTNKGGEMAPGTTNNCNQGPTRGKILPCWSVLQQGNESLTAPEEPSQSWPWPL